MTTFKINNTTFDFLTYSFKGDGKYYTTQQKSRSYGNTIFQNFLNRNSTFVKVISAGNDAPRGGQTGNFVIVEFSEEFKKIAQSFNDNKLSDENSKKDSELKKQVEISGDVKLTSAVIDDQYILDVELANKLIGKDKSEARKLALNNLLNRTKTDITHFYEVMRAI